MIRVFGYYVSGINLVLGALEAVLFFCAFYLGLMVRFGWAYPHDITAGDAVLTGLVFALVMSLSVASMGLYQRGAHDREAGFIVRLAFAFAIGTMLLALIFYLFPVVTMGRGIMALALLFAFVGVVLVREIFARIANAGSQKRRVLVLGAGVNAQRIADLEQGNRRLGFCVVGYVPLPRSQRLIEDPSY